jgi:hypothetical protein
VFDSCSQVCSVEDIQGQEYRAVFVSVTRSEAKNLHHDTQYGIGFLGFPRRLNTAISRSRALLVLVCDPDIVNADPSLKALVDICNSKGDGLILLNLFGKSNFVLQAIAMAGWSRLPLRLPLQPINLRFRMEWLLPKVHSTMLLK